MTIWFTFDSSTVTNPDRHNIEYGNLQNFRNFVLCGKNSYTKFVYQAIVHTMYIANIRCMLETNTLLHENFVHKVIVNEINVIYST